MIFSLFCSVQFSFHQKNEVGHFNPPERKSFRAFTYIHLYGKWEHSNRLNLKPSVYLKVPIMQCGADLCGQLQSRNPSKPQPSLRCLDGTSRNSSTALHPRFFIPPLTSIFLSQRLTSASLIPQTHHLPLICVCVGRSTPFLLPNRCHGACNWLWQSYIQPCGAFYIHKVKGLFAMWAVYENCHSKIWSGNIYSEL